MLHTFTREEINELINFRKGETKLGETITVLNKENNFQQEIKNSKATYVILGVPEDIGVRINHGKEGAHSAFIPSLKSFLNIQQNQYIDGKNILVLGYLNFLEEVKLFDTFSSQKKELIIKQIDEELSSIVKELILNGKVPIIIGGGHNNAFGNLKGLADAKTQKINVINLDAHTDLRKLGKRHSGNGFSYAIDEKYLDKYFIFGIHENYTPQYILDEIHNNNNIEYNTYEEIEVHQTKDFETEIVKALKFINDKPFGIEIDLDCLENFPASAMTPSGFTSKKVRQFLASFSANKNACYLHICEAAPPTGKEESLTGKYISYLISDFIKAKNRV